MENLDEVQQQIWQRVFDRPGEAQGEDFRTLQVAAMELAGSYRYLTGVMTGWGKELVRQLYEGEMANLACLYGLRILSGGTEEVLKIWNPVKEPVTKMLEKCYHRTRRSMVEYMSRSADTEFGAVYRGLADRQGRHCVILAELLGRLRSGEYKK